MVRRMLIGLLQAFGVRKYMPEGESMSPDRELSSTTSYIDMRLAEVYLNYAEAVVENGSGIWR